METNSKADAAPDLDEPLWGAKEISKVIKRSERATFHLLQARLLPATKIGDRYVTTRRRLRQAILGGPA